MCTHVCAGGQLVTLKEPVVQSSFPQPYSSAPLSAYNGDHAAHEGNWASQAGIHLLPNPMTRQDTLYVGVLFYSGMSPREIIVEYL